MAAEDGVPHSPGVKDRIRAFECRMSTENTSPPPTNTRRRTTAVVTRPAVACYGDAATLGVVSPAVCCPPRRFEHRIHDGIISIVQGLGEGYPRGVEVVEVFSMAVSSHLFLYLYFTSLLKYKVIGAQDTTCVGPVRRVGPLNLNRTLRTRSLPGMGPVRGSEISEPEPDPPNAFSPVRSGVHQIW